MDDAERQTRLERGDPERPPDEVADERPAEHPVDAEPERPPLLAEEGVNERTADMLEEAPTSSDDAGTQADD
jgi:hypothetical protein